jgi:peroxiredoxin Q/BCP
MNIEINSPAPQFEFIGADGNIHNLADYTGKIVVLYFYPKDNTSGCTAEACDWRDSMHRITSLGAVVIGVSPDSAASHAKFKEKYELNFELVADTDKKICVDYDVWKEKSMYGKKYMGVERSTFIIGKDGLVKQIYRKVKVAGHAEEVINFIKTMK